MSIDERTPMLKKIDRYFFWSHLKAFLSALFFALLVLLSMQALRLSGLIVKNNLGFEVVKRIVYGLALSLSPVIAPIAFLFSLLFIFGRMSSDRELIAFQSLGYGPKRMMRPCLVLGVFVALMTVYGNMYLGPYGNRQFEIAIDEAIKNKTAQVLTPGSFNDRFLDFTIYVDAINKETQELKNVFIYDDQRVQPGVFISAQSGIWNRGTESEDLEKGLLLKKGTLLQYDENKKLIRDLQFDSYLFRPQLVKKLGKSKDSPLSQYWNDLVGKRKKNIAPLKKRKVWIEMARRIALGVVCFFFVPLAFYLSLQNKRTAQSKTVALGLVVSGAYWVLYFSLSSFVGSSQLSFFNQEAVVWAFLWIPNLLILLYSLYLSRKWKNA